MTQISTVNVIIIVFVFMVICAAVMGLLIWLMAKPYPKEWEEKENKELERKFKEYDKKQKSQEK